MPVGQLQLHGQGDGPGRLHLHRTPATGSAGFLPRLLHGVDVLVEEAGRPPAHRTRARSDPVSPRHGVDGDVDQQRPGPADHVGADAAGGEFREVGQPVQLADNDAGRFAWRRARPGADAGGSGENIHRLNVLETPAAPPRGA